MSRGRKKMASTYAYCRSFYMKRDGTLYVQAGHDTIEECFRTTLGTPVEIETPSGLILSGIHEDTKKCGIILGDWKLERKLV